MRLMNDKVPFPSRTLPDDVSTVNSPPELDRPCDDLPWPHDTVTVLPKIVVEGRKNVIASC